MSNAIKTRFARELAVAAVEAAWVQWRALGARVTAPRDARSMIDPEALVLITLALRDHEHRSWEVLASWIKRRSTALSIQRIKNLAAGYPQPTGDRLAELARIALDEASDHRWRGLAGGTAGPPRRARDLSAPDITAWDESALVVRLRMGIGVGTQADILAFLLARRGDWATASEIVDALGYNVYAVRRAADRMADDQLILSAAGKPIRYRADDGHWSQILGLKRPAAPWGYWSQAYALVADFVSTFQGGGLDAPTPYLLSTRLRDMVEKHRDAFRLNRIPSPQPGLPPGEYVDAFLSSMQALADRMTNGV